MIFNIYKYIPAMEFLFNCLSLRRLSALALIYWINKSINPPLLAIASK